MNWLESPYLVGMKHGIQSIWYVNENVFFGTNQTSFSLRI